jgi:SAM-dependent methyltransferase
VTEILGDQVVQAEVLEGLAMARNHRRWFASFAVPYLGDHPIEVGAGLGDYAEEWLKSVPRMTVAEADAGRLVALKERFGARPGVDVREIRLPTAQTAAFSAAIAYNVLEHIEDDIDALRSMGRLVRPGGAVVIVVPAFPFAMSPVDVITGHVRRYTRQTMRRALADAGLSVQRLHYANSLGLIGYFAATTVLRMKPGAGPMVWCYDRFVAPATWFAERLVRPPFGQSIVAVARV